MTLHVFSLFSTDNNMEAAKEVLGHCKCVVSGCYYCGDRRRKYERAREEEYIADNYNALASDNGEEQPGAPFHDIFKYV